MEDQRSAGHDFEDDWNEFDDKALYTLDVFKSLYGGYPNEMRWVE